ncbi:hypothetical protein A9507_13110 [Methanobacterium sp. A39]|uniref:Uncharacterized protein n=1 Tax=Methanobacterium bryantii TaxID=2161 RepID=A0A2A2HAF3_METBR|nr:hypothetical protein A9507_13110 [Methanobacterium sp. A39]PAV06402.1 hypothetical protein ASJ80_13510 [Methanobacterium bryantii]
MFFGAGASVPEGAPVQGNLFEKYFSLQLDGKFDEINKRLNSFFKDFFAIDIENDNLKKINFPTFEEILGILELSLDRRESFKNYGLDHNFPEIQQIRQDLIFLIAITIGEELKKSELYKDSNKDKRCHEKLIKRLVDDDNILHTDFISLNYDIILDNALTDMQSKYNLDLDYGIEFTNFEKDYGWSYWRRPRPQKAVHLYKPHGSLNWLYCPTCISTTLTPEQKGVVELFYKPKECKNCGSRMIPIIIPPTFFKVMSNRYLQEIWYKAEDALKNAKRIYFCGYSFPDADIHIKYLLKKAELNGNSNPEIYVINGESRKIKSKETQSRYERFFKGNVNWTGKKFEYFCENDIK